MSHLRAVGVIVVALGISACFGEESRYTYHEDVREIITTKCTTCHYPGGSGPIPLMDYEDAYAYRTIIAQQVEDGLMPPWLPSSDCAPLKHDMSLTAIQKERLLEWAKGGAPAGPEPVTAPPDVITAQTLLPRIDLEIAMEEPYQPNPTFAAYDDFRCLTLDWPLDETTHVRGFEVVPGDPSLVHHLILYVVDPENLDEIEALENEDPDPGFDCYGGLVGTNARAVAGWQPGGQGGEFPGNTGAEIKPGSKLVLNMHYNLLDAKSDRDQTRLRFMLGDSSRQLIPLPVLDPGWLVGDFKIEAGDPNATFTFRYEPTRFFAGLPLVIHGVSLHMHGLGASGKIEILREDGTRECLLDIPRWDFLWAGVYTLEETVTVRKGDELYVECIIDNSAENQQVFDGKKIEPQNLIWDGAAPNEMCAGILGATVAF